MIDHDLRVFVPCAGNADFCLSGPKLVLKQVYAWSDIDLTIKGLWTECSLTDVICNVGVRIGIRAPKLLVEPKPIPIPTFVSSLFPICLTTGNSPSSMPASESAIIDILKPTYITLCSSPPCRTNVTAVMTASAGSIPNQAQVYALHLTTRCFFSFQACFRFWSQPNKNFLAIAVVA